mmetsp:Transcript_12469/g.17902  ORF Transcript_12469/g.17902 Transcript_12469/m.17902 type:complete len:132 (+) Transcript_12469:93-488(+)
MSFQQGAIDEVYRIILQKIVHSRFAVVFRLWKEEHCQKHDVSLRSKLKASVDTNKSSKQQKQKRPAPEQPVMFEFLTKHNGNFKYKYIPPKMTAPHIHHELVPLISAPSCSCLYLLSEIGNGCVGGSAPTK